MTTDQAGSSLSAAVATRDSGPAALIEQYRDSFEAVLPTHIRPEQWIRLAVASLRRDDKLATAAKTDPPSLMRALLNAARMGLEPGTEQFYLTPRKEKGTWTVLGIAGYQGLVELMYRAGAVSSVVVECVYADDQFDYVPGRDERPVHHIDWDADIRGDLRLAYAYAIMRDGATSKVVVLNRADITRIKASSQSASSEYSPWVKHEAAMWQKSAARQLAKWVPTSAERVGVPVPPPVKVESTVRRMTDAEIGQQTHGIDDDDRPANVDENGEVVEAEVIPDEQERLDWPPVAQPVGGAA